jgi:hypothetical protein
VTNLPTVAALTLVLSTATAGAQAPNTSQPKSSAEVAVRPTTTLVGCLYREGQVPGRKPNIVEQAGILEDYILAEAAIAGAQQRPTGTAGSTAAGAVPSTGNMYKVEKIAADRLKVLVGKRVEVTGHIDPEGSSRLGVGGPKPDVGLGPDKVSLPEIEASAIREVQGNCPVIPTPAQVR